MAEFIAFDPNSEVRGLGLLLAIYELGNEARAVLTNHGFTSIDLDKWYPLQPLLNAFQDLSQMGSFNMVSFGMQIPDVLTFPPIGTPLDVILQGMNHNYLANHRGDCGEHIYKKTGTREATITSRNPYPSDFDYGVLYRTVQKYRPTTSREFSVIRAKSPCRKYGDDRCIYTLKW